MSPRRSKTIVVPSGETSRFIHVPSSVSNSMVCRGPKSAFLVGLVVSAADFFVESGVCAWRDAGAETVPTIVVDARARNTKRRRTHRGARRTKYMTSLGVGADGEGAETTLGS